MKSFNEFLSEASQYLEGDAKGMHYMFVTNSNDKTKSVASAFMKNLKSGSSFPDNIVVSGTFDPGKKEDQTVKLKFKDGDYVVQFSYRTPGKIIKSDPEMFVVKIIRKG